MTGFGKTSPLPDDVIELLNLPADQDFLNAADDVLGAFVEALLRRGHSWEHGSPANQEAAQKAAGEQAAAAAQAELMRQEALQQEIEEMNDRAASRESAFGSHTVRSDIDIFVWGSLICCWNCEEPMLVWDARSPGRGMRWVRVPGLDVKSGVDRKRLENHPEVHRAVDAWVRAARPDIPKAHIKMKRTKASGRIYSAFVCPSGDQPMGQYFISRLRPEKWSILGGPAVEPPAPAPAPIATAGAAPRPGTSVRCRLHSTHRQTCDWCRNEVAAKDTKLPAGQGLPRDFGL